MADIEEGYERQYQRVDTEYHGFGLPKERSESGPSLNTLIAMMQIASLGLLLYNSGVISAKLVSIAHKPRECLTIEYNGSGFMEFYGVKQKVKETVPKGRYEVCGTVPIWRAK